MVAAELWRSVSRLSEVAFREQFGTEEACRTALVERRWREGLTCPACGHHGFCALNTRRLFQCNRCKKQLRLTAGTVFQGSKLPLTTWFLALYHLTQSQGGISSIELGRRLGVKQPTAWLLKHKLMQAMARRQIKKPKRQGRVESDDARLGGERGRGAAGTTPIVAAVETIDHGASDPSVQQRAGMDARGAERQPRRLKLTPTGQRRPAGS